MKFTQRVLHETTDLSVKVNDYRSGEVAFAYESGEYLYVGQEVPFNNLWFEIGEANAASGSLSMDIWFGNAWVSCVDLTDETLNLTISGRVSWATNDIKGWDFVDRSADVTGLETTKIYNMYWTRFSWSDSLTSTTTLAYLGQRFAKDLDLFKYYPDLANEDLMEAFETGKRDWKEQSYIATENIISELVTRRVVTARGQILDWYMLREPCVHKMAELIYRGLGEPFRESLNQARKDFKESMNFEHFRVDKNNDANITPHEKRISSTYMGR